MSTNYKNIVITPNISTAANVVPVIQFSGGDGTTNTDINLRVYTTQNGTLSFEGSAGQLFSITNDLSNSIFSVNDVSGIPSIDVYANGDIFLASISGNTTISGNAFFVNGISDRVGIGTIVPTATLQVNGSFLITQNNASQLDVIGEIAEFAHDANNYVQVHVRNANTGAGASGDLVVTADTGTDLLDFIDLGINNSTYSQPTWTINGPRDSYLYPSHGNLAIGTANVLRSVTFFTGGTLSTNERMRISPSGFVGIGNTVPVANLQISGNLLVTQNNASQLDVTGEIAEFAHNANSYTQVHVRNANTGQGASGDLVVTADTGTDTIDFIDLGINNSGFSQPSWTINNPKDGYLYTSNGNLAIGIANTLGFRSITFFTGGTLLANERMRINTGVSIGTTVDPGANSLIVNGNVILTGATAGLGYGTGSGGIVSQATSKVTGVTQNKLVGAVAANSAALTSNTVATFTVTNNLVAATDTVLVNRLNGGTAGAYHIWCDTVAAGSFTISIYNIGLVSLSERLVIGYSVIKAVQA